MQGTDSLHAALQVRVINNVKKLQEVKPNFQEAFKQDGYPSTLPYQQKVRDARFTVLLCQGICTRCFG